MTTQATLEVHRAGRRGRTELSWLNSRHSFSFGSYRDPDRMGFRSLRVLNDDLVAPGGGFGEHGHDEMEIITWVLDGALAHRDSTGTSGVIGPGDAQVMSAGRGIRHSEMNASSQSPVHFLQIWIEPEARGLEPAYQQHAFPADARRDRWQLVASGDGRDGSLRVRRDARLSIAELRAGRELGLALPVGRYGYLHVASGLIAVGDTVLEAGDAVTVEGPADLDLRAQADGQVLFFNLS